jgi:hypothetical protein
MRRRLRGIRRRSLGPRSRCSCPGGSRASPASVDAVAGISGGGFPPGRAGTDDRLRNGCRNAFIETRQIFYRIRTLPHLPHCAGCPTDSSTSQGFGPIVGGPGVSGENSPTARLPESRPEAWGHPCRPTDLDRRSSARHLRRMAMAAAAPAFSRLFGVFSETGLVPSSELAPPPSGRRPFRCRDRRPALRTDPRGTAAATRCGSAVTAAPGVDRVQYESLGLSC